jgi:hypothetical protein
VRIGSSWENEGGAWTKLDVEVSDADLVVVPTNPLLKFSVLSNLATALLTAKLVSSGRLSLESGKLTIAEAQKVFKPYCDIP